MSTNKILRFDLLRQVRSTASPLRQRSEASRLTIKLPLTGFFLLLLIQGCSMLGHTAVNTDPPPLLLAKQDAGGENRFSDSTPQQPTVVESAMQLSEKYALLAEQAGQLRQKSDQLSAENRSLKEKYSTASTELKQAQKELAEANKLLLDMRVELNNWKNNILGFRDEMRQADIEQLKAITQILTILGGNSTTDPNKTQTPILSKEN